MRLACVAAFLAVLAVCAGFAGPFPASVSAAPAASAPAAGASGVALVPGSAELAAFGLRPSRASVATAERQLSGALGAAARRLLAGAQVQAAGAVAAGEQVQFDAFVVRSPADAARVLAAWGRAHRARALRIADGGAVADTASRRRAVAEVLWRQGARLGLVVLSTTRHLAAAAAAATGYAFSAQPALSSALASTPLQRVLDQVRPDGTFSKTTALEAFALEYGRLPGVRVPSGRQAPVEDGTSALLWALAYSSRMSAAQRRAFDRLAGLPAPSGRLRARIASYGDPGFRQDAYIQGIVNNWIPMIAARLGIPMSLKVIAGYTSTDVPGAFADALPLNASEQANGGTPVYCRVRVPPIGQAPGVDPVFLSLALAHETFHCFQFEIRGDRTWTPLPNWIIEGTADWAALSVDPVSYAIGGGNLSTYIATPGASLFQRSYDAVGFWGHVQDVYANLWSRIPAILNAGGNEASFDAAGGGVDYFLNTWGSSAFNRHDAGGWPWQMVSPIAPPADVSPPASNLTPFGLPSYVYAAPHTTSPYVLYGNANDPIVNVRIDGPARLSQLDNITDLGDAWYCTGASCTCPAGTTGTPPPTRPLETPARLGLAAGDSGTHGTVTAFPLSDWCTKKPTTPPSNDNSTDAGTGGDPHLLAFEGTFYDFQAAGEFTLLKSSTTSDLEIQVRQQPFPHSRSIAVNSAVAMRVGGATVEIDSASHNGVSALVDHRPLRGSTAALAGGGSLALVHTALSLPAGVTPASICKSVGFSRGVGLTLCEALMQALVGGSTTATVRWRDGTEVDVSNSLTSPDAQHWAPALSIQISVARGRIGHLEGLLGNTGVPARRVFLSRSGTPYPADELINGGVGGSGAAFKALYDGFGASWRITQRTSLFTYARGKSTRSYTTPRLPAAAFNPRHATRRPAAGSRRRLPGGRDRQCARQARLRVRRAGDRQRRLRRWRPNAADRRDRAVDPGDRDAGRCIRSSSGPAAASRGSHTTRAPGTHTSPGSTTATPRSTSACSPRRRRTATRAPARTSSPTRSR